MDEDKVLTGTDPSELSQTDQDLLKAILRKNPDVLTPDEIRILNARVSYLSDSQVKAYKDVMKQQAKLDAELAAEEAGETKGDKTSEEDQVAE